MSDQAASQLTTPLVSVDSSATPSVPTTPLSDIDVEETFERYVLVTGGLGHVGSHTTAELLKAGYNVIVIDDLSNSHKVVLKRIRLIVNEHYAKIGCTPPILEFLNVDYCNTSSMRSLLDTFAMQPSEPSSFPVHRSKITGVIHFAALK